MSEPLRELVIRDQRIGGEHSHLKALIDEQGRLVLEGVDTGDSVREHWGDFDYEYWVEVEPEWKDTVLLRLIKDRFALSGEFMQWLKAGAIPHEFDSYA